MEAGGDPVGWGRYRMGILDWVNKREGLTGFCGWPGPTSLQELPGGWEGTPNYPKVGKGPQGGKSPAFQRQGGAPEGSLGSRGAAAATCAPLPTWALGGTARGRSYGGRAALRLAGGGRRGLVMRVTRAPAIGRRGGAAMVTGRGGAGARPGNGVMAAAAGAALLMLLMAAALAEGDDSDWVRLPSKCEGKWSLGGPGRSAPPAVGSGRGLLVRGCAPAGCPSARLPPRAPPFPAVT